MRTVQVGHQVGVVWILQQLHFHQVRRMARRFEGLGNHQRDGLAAVQDLVVVQRTERRTGRRRHVLVEQVHAAHMRAVLVGDDLQHAGDCACCIQMEGNDLTLGNAAVDHHAIGQIRHRPFGGITCLSGDFARPSMRVTPVPVGR